MPHTLFQITDDQLETGLRGVPVGYCTTSHVDPEKGIFYVEKPIVEVARWQPEKVIYLLYYGREGNADELKKFSQTLRQKAECSPEVIDAIYRLPKRGHPMELFACALLLLGMYEGVENYREDCINLIAKAPHLVAAVINHHAGWGITPTPRPDLGYMENFAYMLQVPKGNDQELTEAFKLFNILHYDHGGGNLSAFVGKAVASGLEDMYGSMASAMLALSGPRHGKANQDCLEFVKSVMKEAGDNLTASFIEQILRQRLANNQLVYGFGHAVLRFEDARAAVLYDYAQKHYAQDPLVKTAFLLRSEGTKVLKENPKIADPFPNVDAISGTVLSAAGFPYPEYFTVLFGLSRIVGISIQIVYERCEARGGKGTPIIRPNYVYRSRNTVS